MQRVAEWSTLNLRWLKGKKKKKPEKRATVPDAGVEVRMKSTWLASFEKQLQPQGTLKADGDVTQMKIFKKSMFTWMNYVRREGVEITNNLYWNILANICDQTMRTKLEAVNGIEELGEVKIWELIESIYQTSNPGFIRRHKCYGLEPIKGELTSDFADRLKLEFEESEMSKATPWSFFEYKVIESLNSSVPDQKDLKTKLLQELKKNPNPDITACEGFVRTIREHEAVINAREYKEDTGGRTVKLVKPQGELTGQQHPPHKVCGKVHGKGECQYKGKECKKPHREDDCYTLHPEKRPSHLNR